MALLTSYRSRRSSGLRYCFGGWLFVLVLPLCYYSFGLSLSSRCQQQNTNTFLTTIAISNRARQLFDFSSPAAACDCLATHLQKQWRRYRGIRDHRKGTRSWSRRRQRSRENPRDDGNSGRQSKEKDSEWSWSSRGWDIESRRRERSTSVTINVGHASAGSYSVLLRQPRDDGSTSESERSDASWI